MRDRMSEFENPLLGKESIELTTTENNPDKKLIAEFMSNVTKVRIQIEKMKKANTEIQKMALELAKEKISGEEKRLNKNIELIMKSTERNQKNIKECIDLMKEDLEASKVKYPDEPETRSKGSLYGALTLQFKEVLKQTQDTQTQYKNIVQNKIKSSLRIIKADASEEELESLAKDPEAANQILSEQLVGKAHKKVQTTVADIQEKYEAILRLEQSVEEVHQLFLDLGQLVHEQSELMDNIESNLLSAIDYEHKGEEKLTEAKKFFDSARKKQCIWLGILLVVVGIAVGLISYFVS